MDFITDRGHGVLLGRKRPASPTALRLLEKM